MPIPNPSTKIEAYIQKMPSLPTSVTKIMEICNNPATSPADLNKVISLDPVLMGKVMKLINSAYYGLSQEVTSLVRAIIMLGINTVKNLALSTAVLSTLGKGSASGPLNMDGFWRHSLCVGVTAKMIAVKRGIDKKNLEEYFIAGLLHDIGKIPLNSVLSDDYIMAMSNSDRMHLPLVSAEKTILSIDHTEVGSMIAENWKISEEIRDAIAFHHSPAEYQGSHKDILYTIVTSNHFANIYEIGFSGNRYPQKIDQAVSAGISIPQSFLDDIEDSVNNEIEKARIFLKLAG